MLIMNEYNFRYTKFSIWSLRKLCVANSCELTKETEQVAELPVRVHLPHRRQWNSPNGTEFFADWVVASAVVTPLSTGRGQRDNLTRRDIRSYGHSNI